MLGTDETNEGDGILKDENGHGTHVAGICGAETNNSVGIAGMNWNSKLMIYQVFKADGSGYASWFKDAVIDAVDNDCKVINFSGGGPSPSSLFTQAIQYAYNNDVLIVISAGNYDPDDNPDKIVEYPAAYSLSYDNVIAVSSTTSSDVLASSSSRGPEVTVSAPGDYIYSTFPNYSVPNRPLNYGYNSGTSMAAPLVSGLAGLLYSMNQSLSPAQVRETIKLSANDLGTTGFDTLYGYGRVNAYNAVRNLYVPQVYSTIQSAVNIATSGQNIIVSGTTSLTSNISIGSDITLTIKSDATINLGGYSIVSTGGTITKEADATINGLRAQLKDPYEANYKGYCGLIQTACSYADSLDEIYIEEGTFNENLSVSNVYGLQIQGVYNETTINGTVSATNCYAIDIGGFDCNGIYLSVCPFGRLNLINVLGTGSGNGCSLYYVNNQPGDIIDVTVWNFLKGFYFFRTKWYFDNNPYSTETWILDNGTSVYAFGANVTLNGTSMCGITYYHIKAWGSTVNAYNCYFDDNDPQISSTLGQVNIYNSSACYLSKKSASNNYNPILSENDEDSNPVFVEFNRINNELSSLSLISSQDTTANGDFDVEKYYGDYISVADNFKYFINKYPSSIYSEIALTTAMYCYDRLWEYKKMKLFLDDIISDDKLSTLQDLAERYSMNYYISQMDYNSAILIADENIQELEKDENLLCDFLYAKGLIQAHNMNQSKEAIESFLKIVNNYPDNSLVELAKNQLMLLGIEVEENTSPNTATNESLEFSTSSYPNPFNPVATINYTLPVDELVVLKVFDILGREVATLVNEEKQAGTYSVKFDASHLASGIYFYRLTSGNFVLTKKCILLK